MRRSARWSPPFPTPATWACRCWSRCSARRRPGRRSSRSCVDLLFTTSLCIALSRLGDAGTHGAEVAVRNALRGVLVQPAAVGDRARRRGVRVRRSSSGRRWCDRRAARRRGVTGRAVHDRRRARALADDERGSHAAGRLRAGGAHEAGAASAAGAGRSAGRDRPGRPARRLHPHGAGAGRRVAEREQRIAMLAETLRRGQRPHRADHPRVDGAGVRDVLRRRSRCSREGSSHRGLAHAMPASSTRSLNRASAQTLQTPSDSGPAPRGCARR